MSGTHWIERSRQHYTQRSRETHRGLKTLSLALVCGVWTIWDWPTNVDALSDWSFLNKIVTILSLCLWLAGVSSLWLSRDSDLVSSVFAGSTVVGYVAHLREIDKRETLAVLTAAQLAVAVLYFLRRGISGDTPRPLPSKSGEEEGARPVPESSPGDSLTEAVGNLQAAPDLQELRPLRLATQQPTGVYGKALKHATTAICFAPIIPVVAEYLIPTSRYQRFAEEETLQIAWKNLAVLSLVFRASAGSESLRMISYPRLPSLFYSLPLGYILPYLVRHAVPARVDELYPAIVGIGVWLGIQVVSKARAPVRQTTTASTQTTGAP